MKSLGASTGYIALGTVVQISRCYGQVFLADQNTCAAVKKAGAEVCVKVAIKAGQLAAVAVVERCAGDTQTLPARDQPALIEQAVTIDGQQIIADQLAGTVIKVAATQAEGLGGGNLAATVVQVTQMLEGQGTFGGDQPARVVQIARCCTEVQCDGLAQQRTLLVVQLPTVGRQGVSRFDKALAVVQQTLNIQLQIAKAGQGAGAVIEVCCLPIHRRSGDPALDIGQGLSNMQGQRAITQELATAVVKVIRR